MKPSREVKCVCCQRSMEIGEKAHISPAGLIDNACFLKFQRLFAPVGETTSDDHLIDSSKY